WAALGRIPRRVTRRSHLCRKTRTPLGSIPMKDMASDSERTLILAPRGRDAVVAKGILREAKVRSEICVDLAELVQEVKRSADLSIITEEATRSPELRELVRWVCAQPPWSDFPFVVLTEHGGGLER